MPPPLVKSIIVLAAMGLTVAQTRNGVSQESYPNRAIWMIVPLPAGGAPDAVTRAIASKLAAKWSQPVQIENRPGFVLNIGAEAVAKALPDGYTFLSTPPGPLVTNQFLQSNLNYDARAFVPVTVIVTFPFILLTHARSPFATLEELIAFAKANPGKLNFASPGIGSPPHLAGEMLKAKAGIQLSHVPYKGLEPALADLLGGHVDLMFHVANDTLEHIQSGKLKALGVGAENRIPELQNAPAIAELLPGFVATTWIAVVAPPKTPPAIVEKMSQAIGEAVRSPDVADRFRAGGMTPVGATPEETATFLRQETDRWREVIVNAGIKPQ
ncbi:Bug family tripartite tricarboxylate transporter substrate binding protein [Bosea sp. LjRoot237]|uniref:Bug family tripartite tricarboxylate transporter substrate binding protein n=1 Tax=Bosea sp. LjRoot237 TaxID=3342292 RepID=UPI003ECE333F